MNSYKIFSFYNYKVHPMVPVYQKAVFDYLGFPIDHVCNNTFATHGDFLNFVCRTETGTDVLIIFDIDCIPLNKEWLQQLLHDLQKGQTIAGAAQTANHLRDGKNLYVSPYFMGIPTAYLKELNYPDMRMTGDMDAGQNLTEKIIATGGKVKYWWPTSVEEKKWNLFHPEHTHFGPGTTYEQSIYHAFFSLHNMSNRFFKKCKSILPWYNFKLQRKKIS